MISSSPLLWKGMLNISNYIFSILQSSTFSSKKRLDYLRFIGPALSLSLNFHFVYIGNQNHHNTDIIVLDYNAKLALILEDTWRELSRLKVYSNALTLGKNATAGANNQAIPSRGKSNKVLLSPALESSYKENLLSDFTHTSKTIGTHTHLSKSRHKCNKIPTHIPIQTQTYTHTHLSKPTHTLPNPHKPTEIHIHTHRHSSTIQWVNNQWVPKINTRRNGGLRRSALNFKKMIRIWNWVLRRKPAFTISNE